MSKQPSNDYTAGGVWRGWQKKRCGKCHASTSVTAKYRPLLPMSQTHWDKRPSTSMGLQVSLRPATFPNNDPFRYTHPSSGHRWVESRGHEG